MPMVPRQWRSTSSHHGSEQLRSPPAPQENNGDISTLQKTIGAAGSQCLATSGLFHARGMCPLSSPQPCGIWGMGSSRPIQVSWDAGPSQPPLFTVPLATSSCHPRVASSTCVVLVGPFSLGHQSDHPKKVTPTHPAASTSCFPRKMCFLSPCLSALHLDEIPADIKRGKVSPPGTADLHLLSTGVDWDGAMTRTPTLTPSWCRAVTWSCTVATSTPRPVTA